MKALSTWKHDQIYEASSDSERPLVFDAGDVPADGPTPLEGVLMALCSCTSVDVISILKKKREPVTSLVVSADAKRAENYPRIFTDIRLTYRVGGDVSQKAIEDAVELSQNKYCSVSIMLGKAAKISYVIEREKATPATEDSPAA